MILWKWEHAVNNRKKVNRIFICIYLVIDKSVHFLTSCLGTAMNYILFLLLCCWHVWVWKNQLVRRGKKSRKLYSKQSNQSFLPSLMKIRLPAKLIHRIITILVRRHFREFACMHNKQYICFYCTFNRSWTKCFPSLLFDRIYMHTRLSTVS